MSFFQHHWTLFWTDFPSPSFRRALVYTDARCSWQSCSSSASFSSSQAKTLVGGDWLINTCIYVHVHISLSHYNSGWHEESPDWLRGVAFSTLLSLSERLNMLLWIEENCTVNVSDILNSICWMLGVWQARPTIDSQQPLRALPCSGVTAWGFELSLILLSSGAGIADRRTWDIAVILHCEISQS